MITSALREKIIAQAFRCPSVHNVQPWLLQIHQDSLIVYDDLQRVLHIGDPKLHDHEVSMGAFIEGLDLILSTEGLGIGEIINLNAREVSYQSRKIRERFKITITKKSATDPLALQIPERKSYRGVFTKNTPLDRQTLDQAMTTAISAVVSDPQELKSWAKIYDDCAARGNAIAPYQQELYSWLRLTDKHPQYKKDGLNREALSLSSIEGTFANILMRPAIYKKLNQWGLAKVLVSEAPQIQSATGLLFIFKSPEATPLESGRAFYRLWLELTAQGFYACPLSSLVDDVETRKLIENKFKDKIPLNVLRVGRISKAKLYNSPRIDPTDKIIGGTSHEN